MRANNQFYLANDNGTTSSKWGSTDTAVTLSGFNAIPAGYISGDGALARDFSFIADWWSASASGSYWNINYNTPGIRAGGGAANFWFSVRCVKN